MSNRSDSNEDIEKADKNHDTNPSHTPARSQNTNGYLTSLPPPDPYALHVRNLSLQAPAPPVQIPFTVPINVPAPIARKMGMDIPQPKELLHKISFDCMPGELMAIIGGSGSGKTTALNAAALRIANLKQTNGSVSFVPLSNKRHSVAIQRRNIGSVVGYVRQDDFLLPYLSVRETLNFAAALRLPKSIDKATKKEIVDQTLAELGLSDVADVIVGGTSGRKGISGGERRRLSIGCILVTLPSVLLLDEPTTGLDATTAYYLLQLLSNLSRRGRTIVLTIHQPRSDAFALFDRLVLLSSGSVAYSGLRSDILPYFSKLGYEPDLHTNPLDWLLDISSVDQRDDAAEESTKRRVADLTDAWQNHQGDESDDNAEINEKRDKRRLIRQSMAGLLHARPKDDEADAPLKRSSLWSQCKLLTVRASKNLLRDRGTLLGFLTQSVLIGVMTGLSYGLWEGVKNPTDVQTFKTILFYGYSIYMYILIVLYVYLNCKSLVVFDREREDGLYGAVPFVVSTFLSYLPVNIVAPGIFSIIIYFMSGYRHDDLARNLFIVLGGFWMTAQAVLGYSLLMTSFNRGFPEASTTANAFAILFIMSAGYIVIEVPGYIAWTRFLSPYYYAFHWNAITQLTNRRFPCEGLSGAAANQCSGDQVLAGLRFEDYPLRVYPLGLLGFILVTFFLATLILHAYHPGGVKFAKQQVAPSAKERQPEAEKLLTRGSSKRDPVTVHLRDLQLTVSRRALPLANSGEKAEEKIIIQRMNAKFESGKVTAILGPSGSGKTSLLQLLAGRLSTASAFKSSGHVSFNGEEGLTAARSMSAFVEQHDDYHLPALTVRETLHYAAKLRLRGMSSSAKRMRAEEILRALGLKACADNLVGGELVKGISGGEKRRLSLAVELLSDPAVLLVDEPTSGLDSYNARSVMQVLRDIADSGRTVIVSIHQPSSEIWTSFDDCLIMAKGGHTVTFSPRSQILDVFKSAGFSCPAYYNPADFILDSIAIDIRSEEARAESMARLDKIIQVAKAYQSARELEEGMSSSATAGNDAQNSMVKSKARPSQAFVVAFPVVLSRAFKNLRRQKDVFVVRLFNPPFLAILFWLFFLRLKKDPIGAQNRVGVIQEVSSIPFVGMLTAVAIYPKERDAFFHERISAAKYSTFTFLASYTAQELPMQIIAALLFSVVFIYGIDLQGEPRKFFEFAFGIWAILNFGESVGIAFATWVVNGGLAISVISVALTLASQIAGVTSVSIPNWLQIIAWATPLKLVSRIQIINEMQGLNFNCNAESIASGVCIAQTGEQLLQTFQIFDTDTGKYCAILLALVVIYRLLAFLAIQLRVSLL